jgi:hypothetical protein
MRLDLSFNPLSYLTVQCTINDDCDDHDACFTLFVQKIHCCAFTTIFKHAANCRCHNPFRRGFLVRSLSCTLGIHAAADAACGVL